jgi:hypothetical protein
VGDAMKAKGVTELLIGCGSNRDKKLAFAEQREWRNLVTLDIMPSHKPDVVWDLTKLPLPFGDDAFEEIHAYDVLEHIGTQGDWRFFFAQWMDFWRLLKPGGIFFGISPHESSPWAWGDPGHTRIISHASFTFLHQPAYRAQVGQTAMTDYRGAFRGDFDLLHNQVDDDRQFKFALRAVKPPRTES